MFTSVTVGRLFTTYIVEAFTGFIVSLPRYDAVTFNVSPTFIEVLVQLYTPFVTLTVLLSITSFPSVTVMLIWPVMLFPSPSTNVPLYVTSSYTITGLGLSDIVNVAFCLSGVISVNSVG